MTYAPRAPWDAWHSRDIRAIRRLLRQLDPPRLPWSLERSPEERERINLALDAWDASEALREERAERAHEAGRLAHRRELHAALGRALDVAEAGGDGLGPPAPAEVIAEQRAAWRREGVDLAAMESGDAPRSFCAFVR